MTVDEIDRLIEAFEQKRTAALARVVSFVEDTRPGFEQLLNRLHSKVGSAHRIGITGPPGVGKSTLVEGLVETYRRRGKTVAVVAVDPTSPFTGGALLGDRVRMESIALDHGVFIRSMATRGAIGGVAATTREVCDVLDAFGFDRIIIETVGVGQSELAITNTADTAILVLTPESGDGVQVLKAGVMEIADIYVVNKADREGADRLGREVTAMLDIRREAVAQRGTGSVRRKGPGDENGWAPSVNLTSALSGSGVVELIDAIEQHASTLEETGQLLVLRREHLARHTREVVDRALRHLVWLDADGEASLSAGLERVVAGEVSPYQLAQEIVTAAVAR